MLEAYRAHAAERAALGIPPLALEDGAVRMRIDTFALTSNNITYATLGDLMGGAIHALALKTVTPAEAG